MAMDTAEKLALLKSLGATLVDTSITKPSDSTKKIELLKLLGAVPVTPTQDISTPVDSAQIERDMMALNTGSPDTMIPPQAPTTPLGVTAAIDRGLYAGLTSPIAFVADPLIGIVNGLTNGNLPLFSQSVQNILTMVGVPEPQNVIERMFQAGTAGVSGAKAISKTSMDVANQAARLQPSLVGQQKALDIGTRMAANPAQQMVGGGVGALSGQASAEAGANPYVQTLMSILGTAAGGMATPASKLGPMARPSTATAPEPGVMPQQAELPIVEQIPPLETAPPRMAIAEMPVEKTAQLLKKMKGGSTAATKELGASAQINLEDKALSDKMGFDLPVDMFTDSQRIREVFGLMRSKVGSEASGAWSTIKENFVSKADDYLKKLGAQFTGDMVSLPVVSDTIKSELATTSAGLKSGTEPIYTQVAEQVPKTSKASIGKIKAVMKEFTDGVRPKLLSSEEKDLLSILDEGNVTYAELNKLRQRVGEAIGSRTEAFGTKDTRRLNQMYGALAEDQLASVDATGIPGLADQLKAANAMYAKAKMLDKLMVNAFGRDLAGDIGNPLLSSMKSAGTSAARYNRIVAVIPAELRGEAIATAFAEAVRGSRGGGKQNFGALQFKDIYEGLRKNPEMYKDIIKNLPAGSHDTLLGLYSLSKRIVAAEHEITGTGKSLQKPLMDLLEQSGLVGKVLDGASGRVKTMVDIGTSGVAKPFTDALVNGKKDSLAKIGTLLSSDKFQNVLLEQAKKGQASQETLAKLAGSSEFGDYAKSIGIPKEQRFAWIVSAIAAQPKLYQGAK
jgi:hypothetical protein